MRNETVNAKSKIYTILGDPISHSLSPVIHNSCFDRLELDNVFVAMKCNLENADVIMPALKEAGLEGYVYTMPVKGAAVSYMDELGDEAELIGSVNCAYRRDGKLIGHNTDSQGFWNAILEARTEESPEIKKVMVLGAGGMAKAAVAQAAIQGVDKIIVAVPLEDTNFVEDFKNFADRVKEKNYRAEIKVIDWNPELWKEELADCQVVANCTPNGMKGKGDLGQIFPYDDAAAGTIFFDAIYEPMETEYIRNAKDRGFITVPGINLLVHQGVCSFYHWTGIWVEPAQMMDDIKIFLKEEKRE